MSASRLQRKKTMTTQKSIMASPISRFWFLTRKADCYNFVPSYFSFSIASPSQQPCDWKDWDHGNLLRVPCMSRRNVLINGVGFKQRETYCVHCTVYMHCSVQENKLKNNSYTVYRRTMLASCSSPEVFIPCIDSFPN